MNLSLYNLFSYSTFFIDELEKLPGDSRTQIGFITYDRVVHFYSMPEGKTCLKKIIIFFEFKYNIFNFFTILFRSNSTNSVDRLWCYGYVFAQSKVKLISRKIFFVNKTNFIWFLSFLVIYWSIWTKLEVWFINY